MLEMSNNNNMSIMVSINEELGNNFENLIDRCKEYREELLRRNHDITEKVIILNLLYFI